ncbi:MAG TPA: hypothetical protein VMM56_17115, partial [Planctomycetaceae bacterium]|nr:hypothetical protein [Planctomycetaceae bacterium]
MSDSQNPVELDSLKSPRRGSKSSPMKGTIIATLLGMVSAVGVFLVIRGYMEDDRKDTSPSEIAQSDTSPQPSAAESANDENPALSTDEPILSAVEPDEKLIAQTDANESKPDDTEPQESDTGAAPDTESSNSDADAETSVSAEPPKLPDRAKQLRLGEEVDLIEIFDPEKHTLEGAWEKVDGKIISDIQRDNSFGLPFE